MNISSKPLVLLLMLLITVYFPSPIKGRTSVAIPNQVTEEYKLHLPLTIRDYPTESIFGIQLDDYTPAGGLDQVIEAQTTWTRMQTFLWSDVEPIEGSIDWDNAASLDQELINASAAGLEVILVLHGAPEWARAFPEIPCGPISRTKYSAFALFMSNTVARYSVPPFNVMYWEIWNEPDIDPELLVDTKSVFGCWGNNDDAFYGGGDYADMLYVVYPAIKAVDPTAQVLVGGLLMDCDPRLLFGCTNNHGKNPSRFLEGILRRNGNMDGGNYFDGISFHAYDYYLGSEGQYSNPNWGTDSNTFGPSLGVKSEFIRETLDNFNVTNKFLMNTESALICNSCEMDITFEATKGNYLIQNYSSAIASGLKTNIWFTIFGWRNSGLLNPDLSPKLAFTAFKFARFLLRDSTYKGEIDSSDINDIVGLRGYKYDLEDHEIWVLWSLDGAGHSVTLNPGVPLEIYDSLGTIITPSSSLIIGLEPIFLVWSQ